MEENLMWTCPVCNYNTEAKSRKKCPWCGKKLMAVDLKKLPFERKPEWPFHANEPENMEKREGYIEYSKFYDKKNYPNGEDS